MTMRFSLQLDELAFSLQLQQSLLHGQQPCLGPAIFFSLSLNSSQTVAVKRLLLEQSVILHCPSEFFYFSREFATLVCQEKCYPATASSVFSLLQHVANRGLPWEVELSVGQRKDQASAGAILRIILPEEASPAASPRTSVSRWTKLARWVGGEVARVPMAGQATATLPRPREGVHPCCTLGQSTPFYVHLPLLMGRVGDLASETEPWGLRLQVKDSRSCST